MKIKKMFGRIVIISRSYDWYSSDLYSITATFRSWNLRIPISPRMQLRKRIEQVTGGKYELVNPIPIKRIL